MNPHRELPGQTDNTGSPASGEPVFLVVGRLGRPHGVHGEIYLQVLSDFPERIQVDKIVFVGPDQQPLRICATRPHRNNLLVSFDGFSNREAVGKLHNHLVFVRRDSIPALPDGEYYHHQLIGLRVVTEEGQLLGKLVEILETGANDVYVVRPKSGREILLPAIRSVISSVNLERGEILVRPLPGLL